LPSNIFRYCAGRPQLAEAFDELAEGDELAIAEWDRARRSMWDGLRIIKAVIDARTSIKVLDRSYTTGPRPWGAVSWRCCRRSRRTSA